MRGESPVSFAMELGLALSWNELKLLRHKLEAAQDACTIVADERYAAGDYWGSKAAEATYDEIGDVIA